LGVVFFSGEEQVKVPNNTLIEFPGGSKAIITEVVTHGNQVIQQLCWQLNDGSTATYQMGADTATPFGTIPFKLKPFKVCALS
jgi:hypothetical protein